MNKTKLYEPKNKLTPTSIQLSSRCYIDLFDPSASPFTFDDVNRGLQEARFRNQTTVPITIGDHSKRAARIALITNQPLDVVLALFLHDAGEFPLGDFPGPIKKYVRVEKTPGVLVTLEEIEREIRETVIHRVLVKNTRLAERVCELCNEPRGLVRQIDTITLNAEALLWLPGSEDWAHWDHEYLHARGSLDGLLVTWSTILPALVEPSDYSWGEIAYEIAASAGADQTTLALCVHRALTS